MRKLLFPFLASMCQAVEEIRMGLGNGSQHEMDCSCNSSRKTQFYVDPIGESLWLSLEIHSFYDLPHCEHLHPRAPSLILQ